jgi:NadR type nicotinamide-nucleotide adenylyltransferase
MFPEANVIHHYDDIPQDPSEDPNFWQIWEDSIKRHCPGEEFDCLFGSEDYGWKMAEKMGIQYIPVNRKRNLVPISGTEMRNNPMKYWEYLPNIVRPYFLKRVCIVGAESTGKSTLAQSLAEHYKTSYVEEYGWNILHEYYANSVRKEGEVLINDFPNIARGQIASEEALAQRANKVLFCDTDLITTQYWAQYYCKECPKWIEEEAKNRKYDLYLVLDSNTPFVDENFRVMNKQADRDAYGKWWEMELIRRGRPFVKISGDWHTRFKQACTAIDSLLKN